MRYRTAFTLIELLVVVAIIVALLAILLPSMGKAVESANRAVCGSQLHQMQLAHVTFASDNFGNLTAGQVVTDTVSAGVYMVWQSTLNNYAPNAPHQRYRGNGYLVRAGYLQSPEILYCPSWSHPGIRYGGPGGWPDDGSHPSALGKTIVQTSYHYRSSFNAPNWRAARLSVDGGDEILLTDHFSGSNWAGVDFGHREGYRYVTLGGAGGWHDDPDYKIRDYNAGATYNVNLGGYLLQEEVFNEVMGR